MHELGIANSVLHAMQAEMRRYPGAYPSRIGLRVGQMTAVDEAALRFCFEAITRETDFESVILEIEICPLRYRCPQCARDFIVQEYVFRCPSCANLETECVGGDELELAYLEVEEHGTSTVGAQST